MSLPHDAYERVKKLRQEVPRISPAAEKMVDRPRESLPPIEACLDNIPENVSCLQRREEDVSFSCPHTDPVAECCDPNKRV